MSEIVRILRAVVLMCWSFGFLIENFVSAEEIKKTYFSESFFPNQFEGFFVNEGMQNTPIMRFYARRSFVPFWIEKVDRINSLAAAISETTNHGLPKNKYDFLKNNKTVSMYEFEFFAMQSFLSIISDLSSGVLNPEKVDDAISVYPRDVNYEEIFRELEKVTEDNLNVKNFVYNFAPKSMEYKKLLGELERLRVVILNNDWGDTVPEDKFLGFKLNHSNVCDLRSRLFRMGYLTFDSGSNLYDGEIKSAVQLFQADHGLNDDGLAGDFTLQAINISARTRLTQVLVNLERVRWNDFTGETKYILVNQPNFQAYLIENDEVIWQSRVVIGLPEHQTQEFSDLMTHLIINPVWHVPRSISVEEYLPIIKENPDFLIENDMDLLVRGTDKIIDANLIDMSQFETDNFPFMIKQNPSNINALGVVKFMFPNEFNIYMHDTPMKELFFKDERTFSHGCVRVQDPFQFAFKLLRDQEEDPQKTFLKFLQTKEERQINLSNPIPVNLIYRTVFFGDYGQPQYRSDIYGRDAAVFMALQDAGVKIQI